MFCFTLHAFGIGIEYVRLPIRLLARSLAHSLVGGSYPTTFPSQIETCTHFDPLKSTAMYHGCIGLSAMLAIRFSLKMVNLWSLLLDSLYRCGCISQTIMKQTNKQNNSLSLWCWWRRRLRDDGSLSFQRKHGIAILAHIYARNLRMLDWDKCTIR